MNIDRYKQYSVSEDDLITGEEKVHLDRCKYTWEKLYIPFYKKNLHPDAEKFKQVEAFWEGTDFETRNNGVIEYKNECIKENDFQIFITGDVIFNFKEGDSSKTYEPIRKVIIKNCTEKDREKYLAKLERCSHMHHSLLNFSLMPETGGMNNCKGSHNDRFDTFIYLLNEYYKNPDRYNDPNFSIKNSVFSGSRGINKKRLKNFLDYHVGDVYKYCEYFYLLRDKVFVDALIENGKKNLCSVDVAVRYMDLAVEYWEKRYKIITGNDE